MRVLLGEPELSNPLMVFWENSKKPKILHYYYFIILLFYLLVLSSCFGKVPKKTKTNCRGVIIRYSNFILKWFYVNCSTLTKLMADMLKSGTFFFYLCFSFFFTARSKVLLY